MKNRAKQVLGILVFILLIAGSCFFMNKMLYKENVIYKNMSYSSLDNKKREVSDLYVVFYSTSCGTCKKLKSDLSSLKKENKDIANLEIYGINIDEGEKNIESILEMYNVEGVPFVIHYVEGKQEGILYEDITKKDIIAFLSK